MTTTAVAQGAAAARFVIDLTPETAEVGTTVSVSSPDAWPIGTQCQVSFSTAAPPSQQTCAVLSGLPPDTTTTATTDTTTTATSETTANTTATASVEPVTLAGTLTATFQVPPDESPGPQEVAVCDYERDRAAPLFCSAPAQATFTAIPPPTTSTATTTPSSSTTSSVTSAPTGGAGGGSNTTVRNQSGGSASGIPGKGGGGAAGPGPWLLGAVLIGVVLVGAGWFLLRGRVIRRARPVPPHGVSVEVEGRAPIRLAHWTQAAPSRGSRSHVVVVAVEASDVLPLFAARPPAWVRATTTGARGRRPLRDYRGGR